jgi:Zn-finger nucleic acid-binding protein
MTDQQAKSGVYNCPNCGAAATPESVRCVYCHSSLSTLICSKCYGAIFIGMKHCPWCGENASAGKPVEEAKSKCPRCNVSFILVKASEKMLNECPACGGLWLDNDTLQEICTNREQQQAVMGFNPELTISASTPADPIKRTYIPCPVCKKLMNRRQFSTGSGVIVDWCKAHGTWFDRNELRQIAQFILDGGLQKSREREKLQLEDEREKLREERRTIATLSRLGGEEDLTASKLNFSVDLLGMIGSIWKSLKD